jgi:two-component system chemotaxis sensor kinase CheA
LSNLWADSFLLEAEDLLAEIQECALALDGEGQSTEIVGRLFRAFHTIKGSGAMFGFDYVSKFTHHVETLLDAVREGKVAVSPQLTELVLAAADEIKRLLAVEPSVIPEPSEAREALIATLEAFSPVSAQLPIAANGLIEIDNSAARAQERPWQIVFRPCKDLFACGGNPLLLLRDLGKLGSMDVVAQMEDVPTLEDLEPGTCYLGWTVTLRTAADENAIRDVFVFVENGAELTIRPMANATYPMEVEAQAAVPVGKSLSLDRATKVESRVESTQGLERKPAATDAGKALSKESTVRVPSARLDRLVNRVGELVMNQSRLAQAALLAGTPEMANPVQEMERLVAELRDDVLSIRMLPIGTIFGRYRRLVHDLSAELGKEVDLVTEGADTELDKSILDQLGEPLVHLLRNSIDHGIESADQRVELGKPRRGTVRLSAAHMGSHVVIRIEDDGHGINRQAVRAKAVDKKLIAPEADLSDRELLNLILLPGFSTAERVTNVSGRGVGMDVVKRQIDALRGSLTVASEEGKGTRIALSLPLTLAIIEGLIVQVGGDQFIIPMAAITENVELEHTQRMQKNGRNVVVVRGELIPYIDLRAAFQVEGDAPEIEKVVIVHHGDDRVGLVVDRVLGTHQTVLQPLGKFLRNIEVVSGATIMGDGRVALIFDIAAVVQFVGRQAQQALSDASNTASQATQA